MWCAQVYPDHVWRADFPFLVASIAYRAFVYRMVSEFRRRSDGSEIGSVVLCPLEVEMPVKEKKRQRIYDAIAGPINRARVDVRMATRPGMSLTDVDKLLRDLTEQIWTKVKIEAGLRD